MAAKLNLNEPEVCQKYREGLTCYELGDFYNCGFKTILRILHAHKVEIRKVGINKLSKIDIENIINDYKSNNTNVLKLATKYKVHYSLISNLLKQNNIPRKETELQTKLTKEQETEMVNKYLSRQPSTQILNEYKIGMIRFRKILKKNNIDFDTWNFVYTPPETVQKVINLYQNEKIPTTKIKNLVKLPYQRIRKILIDNNIPFRSKDENFWLKYDENTVNEVIDLNFQQDKTINEIEKITGIDYGVAMRMITKKCGTFKNNSPTQALFTESGQEQEIVEHYKKHNSINGAAEDYDCHSNVILRVLKKHDIYKETERYQYNHDYFDDIDTHEKAYILGFLITDGCNLPDRTTTVLAIHQRDEEILTKINKEICINKEIKTYEVNHDGKFSTFVSMKIHSVKISKRLEELGLPQTKTFKIKPEFWMQGEFANSAILGMMDGDGSFYIRDRRSKGEGICWTFSFIGMKSVCEMMQQIFKDKLGINSSICWASPKYKENKEKPLCIIRVYGNRQNKTLMDWLYQDSRLFMKRKHDNYLALLEHLKQIDAKKQVVV